jgi:hypothetical protein
MPAQAKGLYPWLIALPGLRFDADTTSLRL